MPILPHFIPSQPYDMFGYPGYCCQIAIRRDDPKQAKECWQRGYMGYDTRMLLGTVGLECERRAPKVAAALKKLGPCTSAPVRNEDFLAPAEVA